MSDYNTSISRVFTKKVINQLVNSGRSDTFDYVVKRYIDDPENKTNGQIISEIYHKLGQSYRNEYYYTNTLLNKLLVGIHNVNTTTALSQVRIAKHIADFVMINGEGCVYEIKSDLDNFDRLSDQIYDYFKAFSKVSVLASQHERDKVEILLDRMGDMGSAVGIYVLSDRDTIFSRVSGREPKQYDDNLDLKCLFNLLRKKEYEHIIYTYFGELPQVAPVFYYKSCYELFSTIPVLEAQRLVFLELKKRNKISKIDFDDIPFELKSVIYFSGYNKKLTEISDLLQRQYRRY